MACNDGIESNRLRSEFVVACQGGWNGIESNRIGGGLVFLHGFEFRVVWVVSVRMYCSHTILRFFVLETQTARRHISIHRRHQNRDFAVSGTTVLLVIPDCRSSPRLFRPPPFYFFFCCFLRLLVDLPALMVLLPFILPSSSFLRVNF